MDLTGWVEFFVQGLSTQMAEIIERGKRIILRVRRVPQASLYP
jgi:hypothetical protein